MYGLDDLRQATFRFLTRNFRLIRSEARSSLNVLQEHPAIMMEVMMEAL